jgi:hypothetical protein
MSSLLLLMKLKKVFSTEGFYIHRNSNNVAWLPTRLRKGWLSVGCSKSFALTRRFPRNRSGRQPERSSFYETVQLVWHPRQSQFADAISQRIFGENKMQPHETFTGSYQPGDVEFLLKPVVIEMTPVDQKEELIQSGKKHYSDMLSQEPAPTQWHLDLFHRALDRGAERLAKEVTQLAISLERFGDEPIVLASLVRAGTARRYAAPGPA